MNTVATKPSAERTIDRVYEQLREMAIQFKLRPGERLNEIELARQLKVSRTPLRQAFNRLASEGFLRAANRGFYCRSLEVKEIANLYELRQETEVIGIRLACARASDQEIVEFRAFAKGEGRKRAGMSAKELVQLDEAFHERLVALSGNHELVRVLQSINARIRFVRCVDLETRVPEVNDEHEELAELLARRDVSGCEELMRRHIGQRQDQIVDVVKACFAQIYVGS